VQALTHAVAAEIPAHLQEWIAHLDADLARERRARAEAEVQVCRISQLIEKHTVHLHHIKRIAVYIDVCIERICRELTTNTRIAVYIDVCVECICREFDDKHISYIYF